MDNPAAIFTDKVQKKTINVGTGSMDRAYWGPLVDRFIANLSDFDFPGRRLDVRENVNFRGRYLAEYVHHYFPRAGCVLAIEVKKFFMCEWTGTVDPVQTNALLVAFRSTVAGLMEELEKLK